MDLVAWFQHLGLRFSALMKELFLSENSRMWWVWVFVAFPLFAFVIGVWELRKTGQRVTLRNLFQFVFPSHIYKSKSFKNDLIIVATLYASYAVVLVLLTSIEAKAIIIKLMGYFNSGVLDKLHLSHLKNAAPINLGEHLFFTFLVILSYDFGYTALHYIFHKVPFLWKFHKVHHSAEYLTPVTVVRFHLVEYVLQRVVEGLTIGLVFGVFYYFRPQHIDMYKVFGLSIFGIIFSSIGVFRHTHIWISYGPLSYIFSSPAMHQIHHSKEERHIDKNLAQIFSFWDYLFGTLYVPKERETFAVGLAHDEEWNQTPSKKVLAVHFKA